MKKFKMILIIIILLIAGSVLYKYYPCLEAYYYNNYIDVSGIKLMMSQENAARALGEDGEYVYGMGGFGRRFIDKGIFVMFSDHGLFSEKVSAIDTENPEHGILGISVGDDTDKARNILYRYGFRKTSYDDDIYSNGNVYVQLFGGNRISMLRIYLQDPAYKGVVW